MAHNITHTCLRELPYEYGENVDILLRLIDIELKEVNFLKKEMNVKTI